MVPNGWEKDIIGNHIDLLSGYPFKSEEYTDCLEGIRLLRGDNVAQNYIRWSDCKRWKNINEIDVKRYALKPYDLVIAMDRTWVSSGLKVAELKEDDIPSLLVQRVSRLRAKKSFIQGLLKQVFNSYRFEQYVKSVQTETAVPHISAQQIKEFPILLPPLPEQKKIARILSTWDKAIETVDKLIENSKQQKKALMQQLLTGKKRLPGFSGEWKKVRLGECAKSLDNRRIPLNSEERASMRGDIPYYGANGLLDYVNKHIFDETIVLLAEDGGYFDEFATRPIAQLIKGKSWVNNHAHVLKAKHNTTEEWLYYSLVHKDIMGFVGGGTRAKLNKSDMLKIPIVLAPRNEQIVIVNIFKTQDQIFESLSLERGKLLKEKQALMQQLLTGKRRVNTEGK